ncbi:MAG: anhydro-N-acetylmuramic acid kinase [Gammaproteobacteria bacterium RIFCSPLOWO2_02_FULL_47_50]|nr:MAG: anhydro-N-acetylmuramic acid kinase [Gammaproteobacteria bacterium RIFCSPLOWO2_01_FULL_47_190]OGT81134.1 MAG: anhydro-N-acetylmuramic acid kinase [Gammaproteobacteria bacterium RIFCSPLOWO2_02_FULL_47_50]OGT87638.1 MAG: anhydro-N-acetylmuramic acid kinase [Gammaproteobacteria bacterium RIFCSPLOWO2_12_FULL_47_76]
MSGTSMDAIDVALVQIDDKSLSLVEYEQFPIDDDIRKAVRQLSITSNIEEISRLDNILGHLFADSVLKILKKANLKSQDITAIGSHGQTILHLPYAEPPRTLQIGDANIIAFKTGITTVADFRRMDIAAGGRGAPLAPAFHVDQFSSDTKHRVILNLGGMANITVLPKNNRDKIIGFDTGPGNALLDDWAQQHLGQPFDKNGLWAESGRVNEALLIACLNDPYFDTPPPKSTGRDYFNTAWLNNILSGQQASISPVDTQATLLKLTVTTISRAIKKHADKTNELLVCGGGIHNPLLIKSLQNELTGIEINSTNKYGLNADCIEAVAFAWLAKCRMDGTAASFPSVTGATSPQILGAIYCPSK